MANTKTSSPDSSKVPAVSSSWVQAENEYRERKQALLGKVTAADVAEAPFVYADRQLVSMSLTRIHLFEKILGIQGAIVECGVHKANSLMLYYHLSTILEPYNFNRKIIGFDTFEGFRSLSSKDDENLAESDFSDTSYERIKDWAETHDLNRAVNHIPKIELVKGDATKTIPDFVASNPHLLVALLYLDFDIYEPTNVALKHLLPLVPKGGVVGFDEINSKKWAGETIAMKENLVVGSIRLQRFYYEPWVSYYVVE
jgi:hypothetical protein